jgi:hypothetical protein
VIYAQDTVVGLLGLAYPVLPRYSWTELELIVVETGGQHTVNHVEKEERVTRESFRMVRGVFSPMAENWEGWVTEFHVVLVVLREVLPRFAEDKGA